MDAELDRKWALHKLFLEINQQYGVPYQKAHSQLMLAQEELHPLKRAYEEAMADIEQARREMHSSTMHVIDYPSYLRAALGRARRILERMKAVQTRIAELEPLREHLLAELDAAHARAGLSEKAVQYLSRFPFNRKSPL